MAMRTIKVLGWGNGSLSSELTATLDGQLVFSGLIELVEMTSNNDSVETMPTLFSFDLPLEYCGVKRMKITKDNASIIFASIVGNYTLYSGPGVEIESGPYEYLDVAPLDDNGIRDPRSNVVINGLSRVPDRNNQLNGTWHWCIGPNTTFEHDLLVTPACC